MIEQLLHNKIHRDAALGSCLSLGAAAQPNLRLWDRCYSTALLPANVSAMLQPRSRRCVQPEELATFSSRIR
eukprot:scaffold6634_cov87-Skeletonema_menzelii.AAC.1